MQLEVDREWFETGIAKVLGAAKGGQMPILNNVILDFDGTLLKLGATDLTLSIETRIPAYGESPGLIVADAGKLYKIARNASSEKLMMTAEGEGGTLRIRSGSSKFTLPTIDPAYFPLMDFDLGPHPVTVDASLLVCAMGRVEHAIPRKTTGYSVGGALLHRIGPDLRLVACDGYRLAYVRIDAAKVEGLEIGDDVVIPLGAILQIPDIVGKAKSVEVAVFDRKLVLSTGDTVMACLLLEETYPDYKVIIPDNLPHALVVPRQALVDAARRLGICANKGFLHVRLRVSAEGLVLESGTEDGGICEDHIPIAWDGPEFNTAYNLSYLNDVLHASTDEKLRFSFRDQFSPGIFTAANGGDALDLIMPMVIG